MAITRAQQAKQMLRNGGMSLQEAKDMAPKGEFLAYINPKEATLLKAAGGSGIMTKAGIPSFVEYGGAEATAGAAAGGEYGGGSPEDTFGGGDKNGRNPMKQFEFKAPPPAYDEFDKPSTRNFDFMKDARKAVNPFGFLTNLPGLAGLAFRALTPNPFGFTPTAPQGIVGGEGGGNQTIPYWAQLGFSSEEEYLASLRAQALSTTEQEPEEPFQLARRFRAEGGIMNSDVVGGEFDFESARQMYGLGKLVKKVTKTVKKIAKSPVGKAALLYVGTAGLGSLGAGGGFGSLFKLGTYAPATVKANLGTSFARFMGGKLAPNLVDEVALTGKQNLFQKALGSIPGGGVTAGIVGTSLLAGLLTPEQEEEAQELSRGEGIDIDSARNAILAASREQYAMDSRARRFKAEGGSIKEPVAKKTMPLLDLDGKEMDLRAEGGFVPIGRMEKADDVPARLSKNEFVFTADAVRNAGDGNVDKGAEVMYNMMKNLEAGGDVSEESQGLEGARKMFQTSQRLEEVL
jgi:hypothetical protein